MLFTRRRVLIPYLWQIHGAPLLSVAGSNARFKRDNALLKHEIEAHNPNLRERWLERGKGADTTLSAGPSAKPR